MKVSHILSSPWFLVGNTGKMVIGIAIIVSGVELNMFSQIDLTNVSTIPDEYLPYMLIASIVMGCLFIRAASLKWYRKGADIENGEKEDKKYLFCTIFSIILGIAGGMYGAIPVTDAIFIGAGVWTYTAVAGILSAVIGIMLNYAFQYGVREMLIKTAETANALKAAALEAKDKLQ